MMETYPMVVFDEEAEVEDDVDKLLRLVLLVEIGFTLDEARAWSSLCGDQNQK